MFPCQRQWRMTGTVNRFCLDITFAVQVGVAYPETSVCFPGSLQNRSSGHSAFLFWYCMRLVILHQLKGMFEQCDDSFFFSFLSFLYCFVQSAWQGSGRFVSSSLFFLLFSFFFFFFFRYRMMSWRKRNRFLLVCLMSADSEEVAPGVFL